METKIDRMNEKLLKLSLENLKMENRIIQYKSEIKILEAQNKWKTIEVDGIPEKGVYVCKINTDYGWTWRTAIIDDGVFKLLHNTVKIKPNYYRLIEEGV